MDERATAERRFLAGALWQEARDALRLMRRTPLFVASAVLTLALGIGANTAIFSVIRAVLIAPLAYHEPDRLVSITVDRVRPATTDLGLAAPRLEQLQTPTRSFTAIGAYLRRPEEVTLSGRDDPESLGLARVSANLFDILGITPIAGRRFVAAEDAPGAPPTAMISAGLWRRRFEADPRIAGRLATFDAIPHTIVGVLPEGFAFPFADIDVWVTRPSETAAIAPRFRRFVTVLIGVARLQPGVSLEQARAELELLNGQYLADPSRRREADAGVTMRVVPLRERTVVDVRPMLWLLFGAVLLVLLIACANVASLLLARAAGRTRELALRSALGASRARLMRHLLVESLLLAIAGGAAGTLLAAWTLRALTRPLAATVPRAAEIGIDGAVLAFTAALSCAAALIFGALPALRASRPRIADMLRDRASASGWGDPGWQAGAAVGASDGSRLHARLRHLSPLRWLPALSGRMGARGALLIGQVALSVVLLISAGLLMKSVARLRGVDPGFKVDGLLTMKVALPSARYDTREACAAFQHALAARVASLSGVDGATLSKVLPTTLAQFTNVEVPGAADAAALQSTAPMVQGVTPDYFRVIGIRLQRGRLFGDRDSAPGAPPVIVINERFARRFWPDYPRGIDPVGQRMGVPIERVASAEIIGVVSDLRERGLAAEAQPTFYMLPAMHAAPVSFLTVRAAPGRDPLTLAPSVREAVRVIDRDQAVSDVMTMAARLDESLGPRRLTLWLLGAFAGVALLLAATGIYGTIAYAVSQRTQEVGVRRALGATPAGILTLIVWQALRLALAGVALGLCAAFAATRLLHALLFEITPTDPATFVAVALIFLAVAAAASLLPAWRAARVDPMEALRA